MIRPISRLGERPSAGAAPLLLSHRLQVWLARAEQRPLPEATFGACPADWNAAPLRCAGMAGEEVLFGAFFGTTRPAPTQADQSTFSASVLRRLASSAAQRYQYGQIRTQPCIIHHIATCRRDLLSNLPLRNILG